MQTTVMVTIKVPQSESCSTSSSELCPPATVCRHGTRQVDGLHHRTLHEKNIPRAGKRWSGPQKPRPLPISETSIPATSTAGFIEARASCASDPIARPPSRPLPPAANVGCPSARCCALGPGSLSISVSSAARTAPARARSASCGDAAAGESAAAGAGLGTLTAAAGGAKWSSSLLATASSIVGAAFATAVTCVRCNVGVHACK